MRFSLEQDLAAWAELFDVFRFEEPIFDRVRRMFIRRQRERREGDKEDDHIKELQLGCAGSGEETPGHIPNPEVKLTCGNCSARGTWCENS